MWGASAAGYACTSVFQLVYRTLVIRDQCYWITSLVATFNQLVLHKSVADMYNPIELNFKQKAALLYTL